MSKWLGKTTCDICGREVSKSGSSFYDCKTRNGCWGLLCQVCYEGVGTKVGQMYNCITKEKVCNLGDSKCTQFTI